MQSVASKEDWYDRERRRYHQFAEQNNISHVAKQWGYIDGQLRRDRLFEVITTVRNFARLIGVPANTDIRLATSDDVETACAGFYDNQLKRPYILVCEDAIFRAPEGREIDVAIALALHEAMHIKHTRKFYLRVRSKDYDRRLQALENLLEDWRIEDLFCQEFVGYARYLYVAREVLIVDQSLCKAIELWPTLADTDKTLAIICAYLRAPHILEQHPQMREWKNLLGHHIFAELREKLQATPRNEGEIAGLAEWLWHRYFEDYRHRALDEVYSQENISADATSRLVLQAMADSQAEQDQMKKRFSFDVLIEAQRQDQTVQQGLSQDVLSALNLLAIDDEQSSSATQSGRAELSLPPQILTEPKRERTRPTLVPSSDQGRQRYTQSLARIRKDAHQLRTAFPKRLSSPAPKHGSTAGSIDRRRLWKLPYREDVFQQRPEIAPGKHLVGLLLDASRSMTEGKRFTAAMDCAVMMNEVFSSHPTVEMHFFSHSTTGANLILQYFGKASAKTAGALGNYQPLCANFDYMAIWSTCKFLETKATPRHKKTLIVVSDGLPCTPESSEGSGVELTKRTVKRVRRSGWTVIGVGLGDAFCEGIYGEQYTLRLPNAEDLNKEMATLLSRLIRQKLTA